jgi:hypothetical protein
LNADLQLGLDQLDRGESITGEELARELDALLKSA